MKLTDSFTSRLSTKRDRRAQQNSLSEIKQRYEALEEHSPEQLLAYLRKFFCALEGYSILASQAVQVLLKASTAGFVSPENSEKTLNSCLQSFGQILSTSPNLDDLRLIRGFAKNLALSLVCFSGTANKGRESLPFVDFCQQAVDAVDVCENILKGNVVFCDNYLAIVWFSCRPEHNKRFRVRGETVVAVKRGSGIWTFDRYSDNVKVPSATLKKARKACQEWSGQELFGQVTHIESERIAKFLGFKVVNKKAFLFPKSCQGFGKADKEKLM